MNGKRAFLTSAKLSTVLLADDLVVREGSLGCVRPGRTSLGLTGRGYEAKIDEI
jgi:hypothetical protein